MRKPKKVKSKRVLKTDSVTLTTGYNVHISSKGELYVRKIKKGKTKNLLLAWNIAKNR